jgi:CRISPR/Cas system Type II protein with McrA/HNH and RuvC-like nuclease domain
MAARKSFTKKERARLFGLYAGRCYLCEGAIDGTKEAYEIEHVIPWALTQDDSDGNLRLAHVKCHKAKTHGAERSMLNKVERQRLKNAGHWPKSKAKIPSRPFQSARGAP